MEDDQAEQAATVQDADEDEDVTERDSDEEEARMVAVEDEMVARAEAQVVERHAELQREYERKEEDRQQLLETRALQDEEAAEAELAVHVDAEEAGEEVEAVVRELRMEAQEAALREMEGSLHALHITAIKEDRRYDAQVERDERRFMQTVEELQEVAIEAEEGRRREEGQAMFERRVVLEEEGVEAIEKEAAQSLFRLKRCSEAEKRYLASKRTT
ncbi:hypothetical protein T484DRAFT_1782815 [Baffinella frigidus]|nr:hypothetical protein T484DRAFT_1782815 [Cryptophyta sp. CCMP2293]